MIVGSRRKQRGALRTHDSASSSRSHAIGGFGSICSPLIVAGLKDVKKDVHYIGLSSTSRWWKGRLVGEEQGGQLRGWPHHRGTHT